MKYRNIVWDYNGTIIDDAWVAVAAENIVLRAHGLPEIDMDFYLSECEMPIENFYRKIYDFDKIDFDKVARDFVANYDKLAVNAKPFDEVCEMIARFDGMGLRQGVISGFETGRLSKSLRQFGLDGYFEFLSGSDDISCGSKSERAAAVIADHGWDPGETLFIGDMLHDAEAALLAGADCVLIAKGHQGKEALLRGGAAVLDSAAELEKYIQ